MCYIFKNSFIINSESVNKIIFKKNKHNKEWKENFHYNWKWWQRSWKSMYKYKISFSFICSLRNQREQEHITRMRSDSPITMEHCSPKLWPEKEFINLSSGCPLPNTFTRNCGDGEANSWIHSRPDIHGMTST